ncbi:MAG: glucosaminidase domain-containing protein [Treponema sp.]|nr:glucosaminidase domain-containing protein [Treponema sp.]
MKKKIILTVSALLAITTLLMLTSCRSTPRPDKNQKSLSKNLLGSGILTAAQLADFFLQNNPNEDYEHIYNFADTYIREAAAEGINSDLAFAQMCLETGFLRFGGLVTPEMHNYCGLGAMDAQHPGEVFETEELGVRAHIQHLQAYATTEEVPLNNELIDPRYNWVHKTKLAITVEDLAGTWATDPAYGAKITAILDRMSAD